MIKGSFKMSFKEIISLLFNNSPATWYRWKNEDRLIVELIEKYFGKNDLEEFVKTKKILKLDKYYYEVALLKLSRLSLREKAILHHVTIKNKNLTTKKELLEAINNFSLIDLAKQQTSQAFKDIIKLNILPVFDQNDLESKGGYPSDRTNLSKFIQENMYDFEVVAWLTEPTFS